MTATTSDLGDRLAAHKLFAGARRSELEWLAQHGELVRYPTGTLIAGKGQPIVKMAIVLSGAVITPMEHSSGRQFVLTVQPGEVTGLIPFSRATGSLGDARAGDGTEIFEVPREHFPELVRDCPDVIERLVHMMLDRSRVRWSLIVQEQQSKALAQLAAGLAHELDNPASAALRGAGMLRQALRDTAAAMEALDTSHLSAEQREALDAARDAARTPAPHSALEREDRRDAVADWLDAHGIQGDLADPLADSALDLATLERLTAMLQGDTLECAVRAMAVEHAAIALTGDVERAVTRIHDLVSSVRRFSNLGRAPGTDLVDVAQGLRDTLAMASDKAKRQANELRLVAEDNLPRVRAGDDLNQVWANLVDNAIDAAGANGRIEINAGVSHGNVVVRVIDDGPGMSADVEARLFDPFFTTKPQGQGLGLGLDTVRRIVVMNGGHIAVETRPGRTEFRVTLPVAGETPGLGGPGTPQ